MGKFHFPPAVRFHPTDQELVSYYLKRKVSGREMKTELIAEVDVYQFEPWELPGRSSLQTKDLEWYFFIPRDRKYPHGFRNKRATESGYWKPTGKDRSVSAGSKTAGKKKPLVYYRGRAPRGERTDWVMHEYRLDDKECDRLHASKNGFVLCRIFQKSGRGPKNGEQYGAHYEGDDWMSSPAVGITEKHQEPGSGDKELHCGAGADSSSNIQTAGDAVSFAFEQQHKITDLGRILESSQQNLDSFLNEILANPDPLFTKNNSAQTQIANTTVEIPVDLDEKYMIPVDPFVVGSIRVPALGYSPVIVTNASFLESAEEEEILNEIYCQVMGEQEVINEVMCTARSFVTMPIGRDFLELKGLELDYGGLGELDNETHNLDSIGFERHCKHSSSPSAQMRILQQHVDLCHQENAQSSVTQDQESKSENEMQILEGLREQCQQNPIVKMADVRSFVDTTDFWDTSEATGLGEPDYDSSLCENLDHFADTFLKGKAVLQSPGLNGDVSCI